MKSYNANAYSSFTILMGFRLPTKVYSLVAVPLCFELAFVLVLVYLQGELEISYKKEIQARKISNTINEALAGCIQAGTSAVMGQASHDHLLIKEGQSKIKGLRRVHNKLLALEGLSPADRKSLEEIAQMLESIFKNFPDYEDVPTRDMESYVIAIHLQAQALIKASNDLLDRQGQVQVSQEVEQEKIRGFLTSCIVLGLILNMILAIALARIFNKGITSRLDTVLENAKRLARGEKLLPKVGGSDEVSDLDSVFHLMAEKIETATEREKAILANSSDVIFSLDSLLELQLVSAASKRLWGYEPEQLQGKEIDFFVAQEDIDELRNTLLTLHESKDSSSSEVRVKCADGSFIDTSLSAFYSAEKKQIFCVAHDISERKSLERQKEDFLSMVSHDLRSPLTSIGLNIELLNKGVFGELNDKGMRLVSQSANDLERLKKLVNDILDADRLEKGRMDLHISKHSSGSIRDAVLQSVQPLAQDSSVEIVTNWSERTVNLDKDRIIQVLINLVSNAIKFSSKGSTVNLNFVATQEFLRFEVKDSGRGIPEGELDKIFEKFRQVSTADATEKGGSGLGLSICKALVEAHEGEIKVQSEVGKGSIFTINIPVPKKS